MWLIGGQSSPCDEVAQPLSVCQSFCHSLGLWILAATQSSPSSHSRGSASGKLLFLPRLVFSVPFFCFFPSFFFYLNFTSCPFSVYYFFISNSGSLGREEGGKHAKRCGIFFIILAPMAIRHKALCPFLHAFPHAQRSPLKLPSSTPHMKSHSSPQANPLPSRRSFHSSVCCPRLLLPAWRALLEQLVKDSVTTKAMKSN